MTIFDFMDRHWFLAFIIIVSVGQLLCLIVKTIAAALGVVFVHKDEDSTSVIRKRKSI